MWDIFRLPGAWGTTNQQIDPGMDMDKPSAESQAVSLENEGQPFPPIRGVERNQCPQNGPAGYPRTLWVGLRFPNAFKNLGMDGNGQSPRFD